MNVSKYKVGSRRFIAFVDNNDIPVKALANSFLYDVFLNASFSTKERIAQELKTVLNYFNSISINIEERVNSGDLLTPSEISAFYGVMRLRKEAFDNLDKLSFIPNVESKNIRNAISASIYNNKKVSIATTTGRVTTLRKYLSYLFDYYHGDSLPPKWLLNSFETLIAKLKAKESYSSHKSNANPVELVESVIPDNIYDKFLKIIKPSDKNNPFKNSKLRNYLMLSIMDQAGIRRSEVCKIKISDCLFDGDYNKIQVYSSPDDPTDPRLNRPDKKSGRSHMSGINASLMKEIAFYIEHVRKTFFRSNQHDFLFISEKDTHGTAGLPITREMVNYMFVIVSKTLNFKINPHLLRHKWNERLSVKGKEKGLDREYLEDIRRNAMGWQPDSAMGRIYNDKHEQLVAIELMTEHQEKIDGSTK
jgi:integrase